MASLKRSRFAILPFERALGSDHLLGTPLGLAGALFPFPVIFTDSSLYRFVAVELNLPDFWWPSNHPPLYGCVRSDYVTSAPFGKI